MEKIQPDSTMFTGAGRLPSINIIEHIKKENEEFNSNSKEIKNVFDDFTWMHFEAFGN